MAQLPNNVVPTSYELDEEHALLHLAWSDDHASIYEYAQLRRACPCAWCAGEGNFAGTMTPDAVLTPEQTVLYELQMVGRYGLTPVWGDGHKTGIYTYERLRDLCDCDDCRQQRGQAARDAAVTP